MNIFSLKQLLVKFMLNYRVIFAYLMALSYLCMHYFVSNTQFNQEHEVDSKISNINEIISKTNSKLISNNNEKSRLFKKNILIYSSSWTSPAANKKNIKKNLISKRSNLALLNKLTKSSELKLIKVDKLPINNNGKPAYNLKNKTNVFYSQILQDQIVLHLLNTTEMNKRNASNDGLFVEAGAFDGETWSNTLHLERFHNWTGLLIEPSIENYKLLLNKNRNAFAINSCICSGNKSTLSNYIEAGPFGITANLTKTTQIFDNQVSNRSNEFIYKMRCHPFAMLLNAFLEEFDYIKKKKSKISINDNKVSVYTRSKPFVFDYLSLDIEGNERRTIETFPWNLYQFNLINIEFNQNKELYDWIKEQLGQYGYKETLIDDLWYQDMFLAHESVYPKLNLTIKKVSEFLNNIKL